MNPIESHSSLKAFRTDHVCGAVSPSRPPVDRFKPIFVACIVALTGSLLFIAWRRECVRILGSDGDALNASLIVFLFGISLGFLDFYMWRCLQTSPRLSLSMLILGTIVFCMIGQRLAPALGLMASGLAPLRSSILVNGIACVSVAAILQFIPWFKR